MTRIKRKNLLDAPQLAERIAKRMARAGLCSRREAERWITDGRVAVNGTVLDTPAVVVNPGDVVVVDGKPLPDAEPTRLWRYHKPVGEVTTAADEKGRKTVFASMPGEMPRVVSVGRLDLNSEGLLLMTNDGELARWLELPEKALKRRYRARVHGIVNLERLANLKNGIEVEGVRYGAIEAELDENAGGGHNPWITSGLREGRNREVRKVLGALDLKVNRLIRLSYGPFQLGNLPRTAVEEVPSRILKDQLAPFFKARIEAAGGPVKSSKKKRKG
ncbi:MAG: hypothetical protein Alpg2KO_15150 [Alphaproteobacteria bacterium]